MSKKRPKNGQRPRTRVLVGTGSKLEAGYWRRRVFKSRYAYKGKVRLVRNWSVKIQHRGKRKTYGLRSSTSAAAAAEACELYRALVSRGGSSAAVQETQRPGPAMLPGERGTVRGNKNSADYWVQRLIRREYTMRNAAETEPELSVRIEHQGISSYFPLGTPDPSAAAERALEVYRTVIGQGWEVANQRFSRELTIGFHWLAQPLVWTYTTLVTQEESPRNEAQRKQEGSDSFGVVVVEPESGIRHALEWCLNQMSGIRCQAAFGSAEEALRCCRGEPPQLVLLNQNLGEKSGALWLEELSIEEPVATGVLYSVHEDSEALFKGTPGGAGTYLLRRTPAMRFLEPIEAVLKRGRLSSEELATAVWQHVRDTLASPPSGGTERQLASLTPREYEVLGLLSKGHSDKDIADQLGISIHTVHEHVRNIFEKLGIHNRTEAVVRFLQK